MEDFLQALKVDSSDVSLYFNLACAYSHLEKADLAYEYLGKAVEMGFDDHLKIDTHDSLAFVRIQPQWDTFKSNGYRMQKQIAESNPNILDQDLLLHQLKKLNELRQKGLITEIEYRTQKARLGRQ